MQSQSPMYFSNVVPQSTLQQIQQQQIAMQQSGYTLNPLTGKISFASPLPPHVFQANAFPSRINTGPPKKGPPYFCEYCGKMFKLKGNYLMHERVHTGETPFGCNVCGKRFKRQYDCTRHQRVHTGEKPFGCRVCGTTFALKCSLRRHEKKHSAEELLEADLKMKADVKPVINTAKATTLSASSTLLKPNPTDKNKESAAVKNGDDGDNDRKGDDGDDVAASNPKDGNGKYVVISSTDTSSKNSSSAARFAPNGGDLPSSQGSFPPKPRCSLAKIMKEVTEAKKRSADQSPERAEKRTKIKEESEPTAPAVTVSSN